MAIIESRVKPGVYGGGPFTHYSLLRTLEDGCGLTGHLATAAQAKPLNLNQIWK